MHNTCIYMSLVMRAVGTEALMEQLWDFVKGVEIFVALLDFKGMLAILNQDS